MLSFTEETLLARLLCRKSENARPWVSGVSLPLLCSRALLAAASIACPTVALPRFTFFTVERRLEGVFGQGRARGGRRQSCGVRKPSTSKSYALAKYSSTTALHLNYE